MLQTTVDAPTGAPHEALWHLAQAGIPARALQVIAELGAADHVPERADEPVAVGELAVRCSVDTQALDRVLRLLCAHGIFQREEAGYRHTAASRLLRSDHPRSMRAFARLNGLPVTSRSIAALDQAVRTGRPGVEVVDPGGFFHYLSAHQDEAAVFEQAMVQKARADVGDLLASYDFTLFKTIADIGGGRGHLLRAVLEAAPQATGVLFDLPDVVSTVTASSDRLRSVGGDFFCDPLPGADLYLVMEILHDWRDREAGAILGAIRRAAAPGATVLIIEHIPPEQGVDIVSQTLDVLMLAVTGGLERTPAELGRLLEASGFTASRVVPTPGPISAIEAVAV